MRRIRKPAIHPLMLFSLVRYLRYGLQMVRAIIIAKYLGPYYLGVWGFITLVLQYLSYSTFGIENGITVLLSTADGEKEEIQNKYTSASVLSIFLVSLLTLSAGIMINWSGVELFPKFEFNQYLKLILVVTISANILQVLTNILRVKRALFKIAVVEIITAVILLIIALLVRSEKVILAQLWGMIISNLLGIAIFLIRFPYKFSLKASKEVFMALARISFPLFIYNLSFYLIMVSPRTILSFYYSLEEVGYYTLANSIAMAALLGFRSIAWAIYPEVLSRLRTGVSIQSARKSINQINQLYSTAVFLTIFICILLMPLFVVYLQQYRQAVPTITILLLAQGILAVSFGYNALAVSRERQKDVAQIGILAIVVVTIISLLVSLLKFDYLFISFAVLAGAFLYTYLNIRLGLNILEIKENRGREYRELLSTGTLFSIGIFSAGIFSEYSLWFNLTGLVVFFVSNWERINTTGKFIRSKIGLGSVEKE